MPNPTQFNWIDPTLNTDGGAVTAGEITGYQIGLRQGGSAGTYPITVAVASPTATSELFSAISPALVSGTYIAAIRSVGPTDSAWSAEITFAITGVPTPPTSFSVS
jgi:hypothetical protein